MNALIIIILGIVQGATEFLPVSSSGHLVLFYNIFGVPEESNTILLSVILHVATLLAVLLVYRKTIWTLIKNPLCKTNRYLVAATIPTVILVLIFKSFIEDLFAGDFLYIGFFVTAAVLALAEFLTRHARKKEAEKAPTGGADVSAVPDVTNVEGMNYVKAALIGVAQGVAATPGVSRSGSTIAAGLIAGVKKEEAANFSFLLSIPIILASLAYELFDMTKTDAPLYFDGPLLILGFAAAFVTGFLCIKLMLKLVKKQKLIFFSAYLVLLGIFLIVNEYALNWF